MKKVISNCNSGLDQLGQWADEWQMEFNLDNCEVMHFGRLNQGRTYSVNGRANVR